MPATDPEELRDALAAHHRALAGIGERHGAHFIRYPGIGAALCFGWPAAHEHDAEHAVRAARSILRAIEGTRVGIATGTVVIDAPAGIADPFTPTITGAPPTRAARLAAAAQAGTINIDNETRRLTGALFEYANAGEVALDGAREPVIRVLRESLVESRYEALRGKQHAPMVGRDEELDLLLRRWRRVVSGEGHVVLVSGEPGIGKSRLVAALPDVSVAKSLARRVQRGVLDLRYTRIAKGRPPISRMKLNPAAMLGGNSNVAIGASNSAIPEIKLGQP